MAHKNDYSVIVFYPNGEAKKWNYVHRIAAFVRFLNKEHPGWRYFNLYKRRSGAYMHRYYPNSLFPNFI